VGNGDVSSVLYEIENSIVFHLIFALEMIVIVEPEITAPIRGTNKSTKNLKELQPRATKETINKKVMTLWEEIWRIWTKK